jgi:hypothetical protein
MNRDALMNALSLRLLVLAVSAAVPPPPGGGQPEVNLHSVLSARSSYVVGQPVIVRFWLEQLGGPPIWILTWNTPFEGASRKPVKLPADGLAGNAFRVTRDGAAVPFRGVMVKRGDPGRDDFLRLEPGKPVIAEVNLAAAYDFGAPGEYRVEFVGGLHDVVREGDPVPRPPGEPRHRKEVRSNTVIVHVVRR